MGVSSRRRKGPSVRTSSLPSSYDTYVHYGFFIKKKKVEEESRVEAVPIPLFQQGVVEMLQAALQVRF